MQIVFKQLWKQRCKVQYQIALYDDEIYLDYADFLLPLFRDMKTGKLNSKTLVAQVLVCLSCTHNSMDCLATSDMFDVQLNS